MSKDKYEDISSNSKPEGFKESTKYRLGRIKVFFLRNRKRNLKALFGIVICLVLVLSALGGAYIRKMLSLINYSEGTQGDPDATFAEEEENLSFATMYDIESADSVKDLMKSWATNGGEKLYSKYVTNILLIGEDNEDNSHRSDSMILASVNSKTKKITLCSFLRDSYTYMNINGSERYDKTNHAYCWAGPSKVMEVISDNYKIKIDHYVSINYSSFIKVINILGGVEVPITESEAAYMNRTTQIKGFESGEKVLLDGQHALVYARIRKLDSEIERTRRQRTLVQSVIKNIKASSLSDLNKAIETFLPFVTTNFKTSEIISLGTQALSDGWLSYPIEGIVEPSEDFRLGVSRYRTFTGYLDVWVIDYIQAAREVQLALYGNTNIEINPETHISAIDLAKGGKNGSGSGYNSNRNTQAETSSRRINFFGKWPENNNDNTTKYEFPAFTHPFSNETQGETDGGYGELLD